MASPRHDRRRLLHGRRAVVVWRRPAPRSPAYRQNWVSTTTSRGPTRRSASASGDGEPVTFVEGSVDVDLDALASELKEALGTGGTVHEASLEPQDDHADRMPALLAKRGFTVDA